MEKLKKPVLYKCSVCVIWKVMIGKKVDWMGYGRKACRISVGKHLGKQS
jgi:hypothetical protein